MPAGFTACLRLDAIFRSTCRDCRLNTDTAAAHDVRAFRGPALLLVLARDERPGGEADGPRDQRAGGEADGTSGSGASIRW